jgi:hypothetical protein
MEATMSRAVVVRYETRAEAAEENQRLVEQVFAQLAMDDPGGLRYATFRLADGVTFVHVAVMEGEGDPLSQLAAFAEFQRGLGGRLVAPPVPADASLVGSYRFLIDSREEGDVRNG